MNNILATMIEQLLKTVANKVNNVELKNINTTINYPYEDREIVVHAEIASISIDIKERRKEIHDGI